jgi:electron transport complex protein RnfG
MSPAAKMIIVLTAVGVISGGTLAMVYKGAEPKIEQQRIKTLKAAIFTVLPQAKSYRTEKKDGLVLYRGFDAKGNPVGIAFKVEGPGFQATVKLMIGLDNRLEKLLGMQVLESVETPGLGGKITTKKFRYQFKGLAIKPRITYVKNRNPATPKKPGQIDAISGATISSKAVVDMINKGIVKVLKVLQ